MSGGTEPESGKESRRPSFFPKEKVHPPVALTIAGSDSSAGAGIQADLKTFSALGVYGLTAVTCVVAETPGKVSRIEGISPETVRAQLDLLLQSFPIGAIKTGLLYSAETISAIVRSLTTSQNVVAPIVVDPVMIATTGDRLLEPGAVALYEGELFPRATLVTPNLDEAAVFLGRKIEDESSMRDAVKELGERFETSVLLKGGHLRATEAVDLLFHRDRITRFSAPYFPGIATHGTGCTYSAAITAGLAGGLDLPSAVGRAKEFVTRSIEKHFQWDSISALNHSAVGGDLGPS
jgi:hydroxymethylpyrimidine/phosphomethylpyrimidine kinase